MVEWEPGAAGGYAEAAFEEGFDEVAGDCTDAEEEGVKENVDLCVVEKCVVGLYLLLDCEYGESAEVPADEAAICFVGTKKFFVDWDAEEWNFCEEDGAHVCHVGWKN